MCFLLRYRQQHQGVQRCWISASCWIHVNHSLQLRKHSKTKHKSIQINSQFLSIISCPWIICILAAFLQYCGPCLWLSLPWDPILEMWCVEIGKKLGWRARLQSNNLEADKTMYSDVRRCSAMQSDVKCTSPVTSSGTTVRSGPRRSCPSCWAELSESAKISGIDQSFTSRSPVVHQSFTSRSPVVHQSFTSRSPVVHQSPLKLASKSDQPPSSSRNNRRVNNRPDSWIRRTWMSKMSNMCLNVQRSSTVANVESRTFQSHFVQINSLRRQFWRCLS